MVEPEIPRFSKVNVMLEVEIVRQLDELASQVRQEIREGKRRNVGRGRPVGMGNIVGDIFRRVLREHPEWVSEWYAQGLISKAASAELPKAAKR